MRLLQTTLTFWCHCCFCLFVLYMVELAFLAVSEKFCRLDTLYYPCLCQLLAKIKEKRNWYFEAFSFPGLKYDRLDIWRRKNILMSKLREIREHLQSFWSKLFQTLQALQIWGSRLQVKGKKESKADWRTSTAVATACFARRINWDIKRKSWLLFNQNWLSGARKYQPQKVRTSDFIFFTIL